MAHLEVKRKSRSKRWLWLILVIIVVIAIAAFCYHRYNGYTANVITTGAAKTAMQYPAAARRVN